MKSLLAGFATLLAFALLAFAAPQEGSYSGEIMDSACAKAGSHATMMKNAGAKNAKECTEACANMGSKYVLFDKSAKKSYQLDDQTKPQQFAGQKVTVKGTLDAASGTIHITSIEQAKGAGKTKAAAHSGL